MCMGAQPLLLPILLSLLNHHVCHVIFKVSLSVVAGAAAGIEGPCLCARHLRVFWYQYATAVAYFAFL